MKNYKNILSIILLLLLVLTNYSCNNILDTKPRSILTQDEVFGDPSALNSYIATLYSALPVDGYDAASGGGSAYSILSGEAMASLQEEQAQLNYGTLYPWWQNGYQAIRKVNGFLENIPNSSLPQEQKKSLEGEAHFIRAFDYFGLVKRYGGVPLITSVQQYQGGNNIGDLQVSRNKEKEVWDFIATECDSAIAFLPEKNESGRATRYAALALKSRAMLYAASIAEYGSVSLNGILGIPSSEATQYWQSAYNAAKSIIQSGLYSLYNKNSDKVNNFTNLFLEPDNSEAILSVHYSYPQKIHRYDVTNIPFAIRGPGGYGSAVQPTLEMIQEFENTNGTKENLKLKKPDGSPVYYKNPTDLFKNKDPRLEATSIVPFASFKNTVIDVQAGIYDQGKKVEAGSYKALYNVDTHEVSQDGSLHIVGSNGFGGPEENRTGFFIRKYMDPSLAQSEVGQADHPWIVFRYAEILLNYAEASVELNRVSDAKSPINKIRERAGIALLNETEITRDRVRHERLVELDLENKRYWDYIRWRTFNKEMNNTQFHALKPYYDVQKDAYQFEIGEVGRFPRTFNPRAYYKKIYENDIETNPNLIQNPGY